MDPKQRKFEEHFSREMVDILEQLQKHRAEIHQAIIAEMLEESPPGPDSNYN